MQLLFKNMFLHCTTVWFPGQGEMSISNTTVGNDSTVGNNNRVNRQQGNRGIEKKSVCSILSQLLTHLNEF